MKSKALKDWCYILGFPAALAVVAYFNVGGEGHLALGLLAVSVLVVALFLGAAFVSERRLDKTHSGLSLFEIKRLPSGVELPFCELQYEPDVRTGFLTQMLEDLGSISRGSFTPTEIVEEQERPDRWRLEFTASGRKVAFDVRLQDGWLEFPSLLLPVNKALEGRDRRFYFHEREDCVRVFSLSADEKLELFQKHGWRFASMDA